MKHNFELSRELQIAADRAADEYIDAPADIEPEWLDEAEAVDEYEVYYTNTNTGKTYVSYETDEEDAICRVKSYLKRPYCTNVYYRKVV